MVRFSEDWLKSRLEENPAISISRSSIMRKPEQIQIETKDKRRKYGNQKVYVYENGIVSTQRLPEKEPASAIYDSEKEYQRHMELLALQNLGIISELERQKKLVIQTTTVYRGETLREISYVADFFYRELNGEYTVEDVKGYDKKNEKYITTESFRLKWKLLKAKYPQYRYLIT